MSQELVADRLNVSRQAVTKWEVGQSKPSAQNLQALAELYGVSSNELLSNAQQKNLNLILRANLTRWAIILQTAFLCSSAHFVNIFRIRHTSTTYKLMLSGGDIKGVQGDTGHAQASMVTERYAHILDDNRRVNAERFQQQFYSSPVSAEPTKQQDPIQELDAGGKQALLLKLLTESPEMAAMIKSLAQVM